MIELEKKKGNQKSYHQKRKINRTSHAGAIW